jgi:hypothetical protein
MTVDNALRPDLVASAADAVGATAASTVDLSD